MPLTYFLAQVLGLYCLVVGCFVLFRRRMFVEVIGRLYNSPTALVSSGAIAMVLGLLMVLSYNYWNAGTLALVVTLVGWAALLKGLALVFMPQSVIARFVGVLKVRELSWFYAIIILVIGAYLAYAGFMG